MTKPFLSVSCRPCGQDFIAHRQGHIIRENISMRIEFGQVRPGFSMEPPNTDLRVKIWDIPPHLIRPDGTIATGSRHILGLRDVLQDLLGMEISDDVGCYHSDISFQPIPGKPGHFELDTWINTNMALDVLDRPEPEVLQTLARPEVSLDPKAINAEALDPDVDELHVA